MSLAGFCCVRTADPPPVLFPPPHSFFFSPSTDLLRLHSRSLFFLEVRRPHFSPSEHPSVPMQKYLPPAGCSGGSRRRHVRERFIVNEAFMVQLHHVTSLLSVLFS